MNIKIVHAGLSCPFPEGGVIQVKIFKQMKFLKYLMILLISFTAVSCVEEMVTPRDGGDDDDPIIEGGTGGSGGGSGQAR